MSVMNLGTAVSPYILGEVADNFSVSTAMWACIVISFLAAAVNMPLLFVAVLKPRRPKPPKWARGLQWEDPEFVDRALSGEWVPSKQLDLLNLERMRKGQPFLVIPIRSYEEDKQKGLSELKAQSKADFIALRDHMAEIIEDQLSTPEEREILLGQLNHSQCTPEQEAELKDGLGKWFVDYVDDNGYCKQQARVSSKVQETNLHGILIFFVIF